MHGNPIPNHQIYILAIAILGSIAEFNSHQYFQLYGIQNIHKVRIRSYECLHVGQIWSWRRRPEWLAWARCRWERRAPWSSCDSCSPSAGSPAGRLAQGLNQKQKEVENIMVNCTCTWQLSRFIFYCDIIRGNHPIACSGEPNPSKRQGHLCVGTCT